MHNAHTVNPRRRRVRRGLLAAAAVVLLAVTALPAAAQASTVELASDGTLNYRGGSGESNNLNVIPAGTAVEVRDLTGATARGPQCTQVSNVRVRCEGSPILIQRMDARLGDRDDKFAIGVAFPVLVDGGPGRDSYTAAAAPRISRVDYRGGGAFDSVSYSNADRGVRLSNDGVDGDGRVGFDQDNIGGDVERLAGSRFLDEITGTGSFPQICCAQVLSGGQGDDTLRANPGAINTVFDTGRVADGADRIIAGGGLSTVDYAERTRPVNVTLNFGGADDGEPGEHDEIIGGNENVFGGQAGDTIRAPAGSTAAHRLDGRAGNDTIDGADGADELFGGDGQDTISAFGGPDVIFANDGESDVVGCGSAIDTAELDSRDGFDGCENRKVGVLRLAPERLRAKAGELVGLRLSWRHPRSWRQLRRIELRLVHDGVAVGTVAISPRGQHLRAAGAVKLVRRASRITRRGRTASARLALRLDRSLAGRRPRVEVEAVDAGGARQLVSRAGSIRVTG